jgi:arylsulfatase A-like enzyme
MSSNPFPGCSGFNSKSKKPPNILFFFPDQHRFDWIGQNKNLPLRTPHLDALAKRGVYFTNAISPSPLCAPSRSNLAAGKEYDHCGVVHNNVNYPVEQTTFYTVLRDSGYHVMGCGKFDLRKPAESWGRDGKQIVDGTNYLHLWGFSDGIDNSGKHDGPRAYSKGKVCPYFNFLEQKGFAQVHMDDFAKRSYPNYANTVPTPLNEEAYADNYIARNGLNLLAKTPNNKPWFIQVNFNGPHEPMDVTKQMKKVWENIPFPQPHKCKEHSPEKHVEIRQNYAAMIENIDFWLGVYMEEIKKRGELENTIIVYSSDHGEMLGDHNRWEKLVPYQPSVGVPLFIAGPGIRQNYICKQPVTIMDLAATFIDYGGAKIPKDMDSVSMRLFLAGKKDQHRKFVRSGLLSWRMVFDGRYKLIRGFDPTQKKVVAKKSDQEEVILLFDLQQDPMEDNNIAHLKPQIVKKLSSHFL